MLFELLTEEHTPIELRELVKTSVALFGKVISEAVGDKQYRQIESIREVMASLRDKKESEVTPILRSTLSQIERMKTGDRRIMARAFTLMLELINTCENAYRSVRLAKHSQEMRAQPQGRTTENVRAAAEKPNSIVYVLTAHPTEARSPENIAIFHLIQRQLIASLERRRSDQDIEASLFHFLNLMWRTAIVRDRAPAVGDEADSIYSTLLERNILDSLLTASGEVLPIFIRSWVGGDKDGHPGVDEKVMKKSLSLSRSHLIDYVHIQLAEVADTLQSLKLLRLGNDLAQLSRVLQTFRTIKNGDGGRLQTLGRRMHKLFSDYESEIGSLHPNLVQLQRLTQMFPGFVVPLELRESSDVLMSDQTKSSRLAIDRMLRTLASLSKGGDPRWYARGFIVSMTSELVHLQVAELKVRRALGRARIPVIPLFEQAAALKKGPEIVRQWLDDPRLGRDVRDEWGGQCEMMIGYSDSSKESGALASRLEIAEAMHDLERLCLSQKVEPIFFQGSGGSVDRGGGAVQDQIAWWPRSALKTYKVTVQGEMVERSLANAEITRGQIERIAKSATEALSKASEPPHLASIRGFADAVADEYRRAIHDPEFLRLVEKATPYSALGELRIGYRPVSRQQQLSVEGLRAIPWVLCWTQTRVLFPTWWGIGTAWKGATPAMKKALRKAFADEPVFTSFVHALGFTLAKVEMPVWRMYLERSRLDPALIDQFYTAFEGEMAGTYEMLRTVTGHDDPLWFKPWLGASIRLRSSMIHPLNLLQILALEDKDFALFRLTVTGISSGMLTTG